MSTNRYNRKTTIVIWEDINGKTYSKTYKGHIPESRHGKMVSQFEKLGACGDVNFYYFDKLKGSDPVKTHSCGI